MKQTNITGCRATCSIVAALLSFAAASSTKAEAGTIPFTFEFSGTAVILGVPTDDNLALPTTATGSVLFDRLGVAAHSEEGTVTFIKLPSGDFVHSSVLNAFVTTFPRGDTLLGTSSVTSGPPAPGGIPLSVTWTFDGGTGIFLGASGGGTAAGVAIPAGSPLDPLNLSFAGTGSITAPALNTVPEPSTIALFGIWMIGVAANVLRRRRRPCNSRLRTEAVTNTLGPTQK